MARKPKTSELEIPPRPQMAPASIRPDDGPLPSLDLPAPAPPPPFFSRSLLLTGVAVACFMGGGAGLWARPAMTERRLPAVVAAPKPEGQLQIVLDEAPPAPIGQPMELMRTDVPAGPVFIAPLPVTPSPPSEPDLRAPTPAPLGLLRVAVVDPEPEPVAPPPRPTPAKPTPKAKAAPVKPKIEKAVIKKAEVAKPAKAAPRLVKTKAAKPVDKPKLTRARVEVKAPPAKLQKIKAGKPDKATKAQKLKTVEKPAKNTRPAKLMKVVETRPKPQPAAKPGLDLAKLLTRLKATAETAKPVMQKAVLKAPPPPAPKPPEPAPQPRPAVQHVAEARNRCDAADPADTLVCENASLQAADRQMTRAYHEAEDAGVEPWRLQQQQRRWLRARTAAARDNPWAVRDVYEARIEELQDLRRAARGGY